MPYHQLIITFTYRKSINYRLNICFGIYCLGAFSIWFLMFKSFNLVPCVSTFNYTLIDRLVISRCDMILIELVESEYKFCHLSESFPIHPLYFKKVVKIIKNFFLNIIPLPNFQ